VFYTRLSLLMLYGLQRKSDSLTVTYTRRLTVIQVNRDRTASLKTQRWRVCQTRACQRELRIPLRNAPFALGSSQQSIRNAVSGLYSTEVPVPNASILPPRYLRGNDSYRSLAAFAVSEYRLFHSPTPTVSAVQLI
jgi:hypothetical protein